MPRKIFERLLSRTGSGLKLGSTAPDASFEQAQELFQRGEIAAANAACRKVLERQSDHLDALLLMAQIAETSQDWDGAIELYTSATLVRPEQALAHYKRGNLLKNKGEMHAALASYNIATTLDPGFANAFCNRGVVLESLNQLEEAQRSYDQAISLNPEDPFAYYNLAGLFRALAQPERSLASYDKAILARPDYAEAHLNRAVLLAELNRWDAALAGYSRCIEMSPLLHQAHFSRAVLLRDRGQLEAALAGYDKAIEIYPQYAEAYCNRGVLLAEIGRWTDAVASFDHALFLKPDFAEVYGNRGDALLHLHEFSAAIESFDQAIALSPEIKFLMGPRLHAKMNICDWHDFESDLNRLETAIQSNRAASPPFYVLGLVDSPALQRQCAEIWVREKCAPDDSLGPIPKRPRPDRLRICYFSADFREHATAHLLAEMIELHDRSRFEVIGFSFGPRTHDSYRKRLEKSFDRFFDVRQKSEIGIAAFSRDLEIDIAIDLGGHTHLSRTRLFSLRAAPLQVSYLGYPGTMGAAYIDYLIADGGVITPETEPYFTEKIIYLPHSYQVNDSKRLIADRVCTRRELGLPEKGFVFCCFNNSYKILPATFHSWMRILRMVPGSVLWLLEGSQRASDNLRQMASAASVAPSRLVFAKRVPAAEHLARHRAADLFLDTVPYNAHTTASDALWAGLPLITYRGECFASRVAAGLLLAIGLPELIAPNQEHYDRIAVELASDPARLSCIRDRLVANRSITPLFDAGLFAKHLETAYVTMHDRYRADLPPANVWVPPTPKGDDGAR